MTTTQHDHWYDLTVHRPWEDWLSATIGVVILFAPMAIATVDNAWVTNSTAFAAVLIVALAALENVSWRRWEESLEALCGLWLVVSPFVLGYGGSQAALNIAAGILVMILGILEFWQDRERTE